MVHVLCNIGHYIDYMRERFEHTSSAQSNILYANCSEKTCIQRQHNNEDRVAQKDVVPFNRNMGDLDVVEANCTPECVSCLLSSSVCVHEIRVVLPACQLVLQRSSKPCISL